MGETGNKASVKRKRWGNIVKLIVFLGIGFLFIYLFLLKLEPFVYLKNTGFDFLKGMLRKKGKQDET